MWPDSNKNVHCILAARCPRAEHSVQPEAAWRRPLSSCTFDGWKLLTPATKNPQPVLTSVKTGSDVSQKTKGGRERGWGCRGRELRTLIGFCFSQGWAATRPAWTFFQIPPNKMGTLKAIVQYKMPMNESNKSNLYSVSVGGAQRTGRGAPRGDAQRKWGVSRREGQAPKGNGRALGGLF